VIEMELLKDRESREIFRLVDQEKHTLEELHGKLEYGKLTISKYIANMELSGIIQGRWEKGEDGYWRRYYRATNWEWARLLREIINTSKQKVITDESN